MKVEYHLDQNKISDFYRVQSMIILRMTLIWTIPLILVDLIFFFIDKPFGIYIVGSSLLFIMVLAIVIRHILKPKLKWEDLKIEIDYKTGNIYRTGTGIFELNANIKEFGRIVKHKEGIKLFKRGWYSWISYLSNYSNLNERNWNFYIPSILKNYEEIEEKFKEKTWI